MLERYLEDLEVGQSFGSGRFCIHEERIKSFAAQFDRQPFYSTRLLPSTLYSGSGS
jgi:acyl dehydratase